MCWYGCWGSTLPGISHYPIFACVPTISPLFCYQGFPTFVTKVSRYVPIKPNNQYNSPDSVGLYKDRTTSTSLFALRIRFAVGHKIPAATSHSSCRGSRSCGKQLAGLYEPQCLWVSCWLGIDLPPHTNQFHPSLLL